MKIALVHDYLYTYGGAERVLEALHDIWPEAPIYTAWVDWQWLKQQQAGWQKWHIVTSWFDKIPFKKFLCSPLRFLTPKIWRSFNLSQYDVVISSSAWYMSKGVSLHKSKDNKTLHICYCHTPPRYLYGYSTSIEFQRFWWGRLYANLINPFMRYYDFNSSQTVDYFICNSREVQKRIAKFYRRVAQIIYPPVFKKASNIKYQVSKEGEYFLMVNRLVRPKNVDLAIKTCRELKLPLKIVGVGSDAQRLKNLANNSPYIEFLGYVDDSKLSKLYTDCKAVFYLASEEDFGITPIEAMSFGKPVIALKSGGIKESILEDKTGIFINKLSVEELAAAIKKLAKLNIKAADCIKQADKFSSARFKQEINTFVAENWQKWHNK